MKKTVPNDKKLTTAEQYEELRRIRDDVVGILATLDEMLGDRPTARPATDVMSAVKVGQKADGARIEGMLLVAQAIVGEFEAGTDPAAIRRVAVATRDRAHELLGEHLMAVMDR